MSTAPEMTVNTEGEEEELVVSPPPKLIHSSSSSSSNSSSSSTTTENGEDEDDSPLDSGSESLFPDEADVVSGKKGSPKKKSSGKSEKPYKLELVLDRSDAKPGFFQYLAVGLWIGWFGFYFYFMLLFPLLYYYFPKALGLLILLMVISGLAPLDRKKQPAWGWKIGAWIMKEAESYFRMRVYCEDYEAVKKAHPAILTTEPHDVLPVGLFVFSDTLGYFKDHKIRGCLASACYSIPFMRNIYTWSDATDINKSTIKRLLDEGCTATICPGGAHEVTFLTTPDAKDVTLYLKNRLGMVKIAAEYGVPLIPTFTFGQRKAYDYFVPQWKWLHTLGRQAGFIPLVFQGMGGIPFAQPHSCPLTMVVAKPVYVPKLGPNAKVEDLMPYHQEFLEAIERIFEKNKVQFGMGDHELKIV